MNRENLRDISTFTFESAPSSESFQGASEKPFTKILFKHV